MVYTRTGRPPGRPKTKEYVTLMARVPQDLADQVTRYARRKRQTVSEVLRDGLLLLVQEEDTYRRFLSDRQTGQVILSDRNARAETAMHEILSDTNSGTGSVSDSPETRPVVMPPHSVTQGEFVSDTKRSAGNVSDTNGDAPGYDTTKDMLGELCAHGHDYAGTGQSVRRRSDNECRQCLRDRDRAYRERKRQALPA